jgi:hypothetical protein
VLCAIVLALCAPAGAADWTQPVAQLVRQIVAITGPGAASLSMRNISSFPAEQAPEVRRALETELRSAGVRLAAPGSAAAEIAVTLSENSRGYVWIAEVTQGSDKKIAMTAVARPRSAGAPQPSASIAIRKTLLWSQETRVLDIAVTEHNALLLDAGGVTVYKLASGKWEQQQRLTFPLDHVFPRDLRGRLVPARDHMFDAYLPGVVCASGNNVPLSMTCYESEDPWPLAAGQSAFFGPVRNFFTGVLAPGVGKQASAAPFYSAAALARPKYTLWVFAQTDGTVHLNDGVNNLAARGTSDWGSDIAAISSGCGLGTQLLVSGAGDAAVPDVVRAFEIADREPAEVSPPVELPGPVPALWTTAGGRSALAVAHNLKMDRYDAFELTITCGQ